MELFFGYAFQEFVNAQKTQLTEELLNRAVWKGIIYPSGAEYLKGLK